MSSGSFMSICRVLGNLGVYCSVFVALVRSKVSWFHSTYSLLPLASRGSNEVRAAAIKAPIDPEFCDF